MIRLNLDPVFTARGIERPYYFLTHNGFTHNIANLLIAGKQQGINFKYLERLCTLLWCEPHDLLLWEPADVTKVPADHPLRPLLHTGDKEKNFRKMMSKVPYKKLNDISDVLKKEIEE
ncbi:helix-turn-helix domain-containing protein [Taibaiella lutea]|uniref:Helix-turn-helix domain-containing protein n=1 Tax=Taibaiella lutea TaxID=2608001 RepID=A0A5M6CN11_9BACT|nr:helix-turn-helix domain-containing protein [Taibaiella lutea]KAA5536433.1 helix-turn-helix domain-containing protein [Taibaiella lutea]